MAELKGKYRIVMVRNGVCEWDEKNIFTGWYNSNLCEKGINDSISAGKVIKKAGFINFDEAHTSILSRAQVTLSLILKEIDQENIPIQKSWRLNEKHSGALTGLDTAATSAKYGDELVYKWRHNFDFPPPPMTPDHPYYNSIVHDEHYRNFLKPEEFPMAESLELTVQRVQPYWTDVIIPQLKAGKNILIVAHSNSLRAIVQLLDGIPNNAIMEVKFLASTPFVYELDVDFKPVVSMKYLWQR